MRVNRANRRPPPRSGPNAPQHPPGPSSASLQGRQITPLHAPPQNTTAQATKPCAARWSRPHSSWPTSFGQQHPHARRQAPLRGTAAKPPPSSPSRERPRATGLPKPRDSATTQPPLRPAASHPVPAPLSPCPNWRRALSERSPSTKHPSPWHPGACTLRNSSKRLVRRKRPGASRSPTSEHSACYLTSSCGSFLTCIPPATAQPSTYAPRGSSQQSDTFELPLEWTPPLRLRGSATPSRQTTSEARSLGTVTAPHPQAP
jgi:hypothetical protein